MRSEPQRWSHYIDPCDVDDAVSYLCRVTPEDALMRASP